MHQHRHYRGSRLDLTIKLHTSTFTFVSHGTLTRIRLDNTGDISVGFAGKVKPSVVGSGAGVDVPPFPASVLGECAAVDVAIGALAPEIPSQPQAGNKV